MKTLIALLAGAAWLAPAPALAANLTVVNVAAPAVNCVFNASCTVTVNDSIGKLSWTAIGDGAWLQSRTYSGAPGTPAAGLTAYEYRLNLTQGAPFTNCIAGLTVNFGPVTKLTYPNNQPAHVFVVTQGGLGSVGIASAEQDGDVITFTFSTYLCAGQTTYFFGLAAAKGPQATTAMLFAIGDPPFIQVEARAPQH
jgi:hypothetical protein